MLQDAYSDAECFAIPLGVSERELSALLKRHCVYFAEATQPHLVHWNLWAGNIFVQERRVTGLIDFEQSMWADILMETGFRTSQQNAAFLRGYGQVTFYQRGAGVDSAIGCLFVSSEPLRV